MTKREVRGRVWVGLVVLFGCCGGCGRAELPATDPEPFRAAIASYLEGHNMAMSIKEIKQGPAVDGTTATLTASLQHASLAGPAVTWQFRFAQNPEGTWVVLSHE